MSPASVFDLIRIDGSVFWGWGSEFGVRSLGLVSGVWGLGFGIWGLEFGVH